MRLLRSAAVAALAALVAFPSLAGAQQDVTKLAERLNKKAMEDYDSLEFDSARQTLLSAIAKLRDAGADETATAAKIYINLGTVYIAGFKDKNRGVQQFVNALKIDGTATLDPERATPELQEAFDEAQKQTGGGGRTKKPPKPDGTGDNGVHGLQHNAIDEAKAGNDVEVKAQLGSDVNASRLFLFYRSGGQEDYVSAPMTSQGRGEWVGTIPGDAMEGKAVQYYIEARDARGRPVIAAGTAASPYIISVTEGKGGPSSVDVDVEDPLKHIRKKHPDDDDKPKGGRGWGRLFLNLMGGVGIGIEPAGNHTEVAYLFEANQGGGTFVPQPIGSTGLAFSPLHFSFEAGVNITQHIALSVVARFGLTLLNNADSSTDPPLHAGVRKAENDFSAMARFTYKFGEGKIRPFLHLGLGGGQIRHVLDISSANDPNHPLVDVVTAQAYATKAPGPMDPINQVCDPSASCVDTIAIGWVLVAVGGGIYIDLVKFTNGGFGINLDGDLIFGVPVGDGGQFGINFDINVGLGLHFL